MISFSKLLSDTSNYGDSLRYHNDVKTAVHGTTGQRGPVVVWNCTRTCNLLCVHCYSDSNGQRQEGEMNTAEAFAMINDLAQFRVPVLLLSGGEPLLRPDIMDIIAHARTRGIRVTISTNGTLIDRPMAKQLKDLGVSYVGISLDGIGETNDRFRGKVGAYDSALAGIRHCLAVGQKVGLRLTMNQQNVQDMDRIFQLVEEEGVPRICFYHLVYSGRGSSLVDSDFTAEQMKDLVSSIASKVEEYQRRGLAKEILTVDNHCDGIYLYLREQRRDPQKAARILELLKTNGGNRTGIAIGCVDWFGKVHPDQFSQDITFGSVRERPFSEIWTDESHAILAGLRNRKPLLKGRCGSCAWLDVCNGNFRARASAISGDVWESDPACYLSDTQISSEFRKEVTAGKGCTA